jgi:TRAP-type C4-dicarboxylate transport system substrate-binding protein
MDKKGLSLRLLLTIGIVMLINGVVLTEYGQTASQKPIILRYSDYGPPGRAVMEAVVKWAEEIEKRTNGNVKVEFHYNGALATAREVPEAMKAGAFEMALSVADYYPAKAPFDKVFSLPFMMGGTAYEFGEKWTRVLFDYYELPPVKKQWEVFGCMALLPQPVPPYELLTVKPIRSIEEIPGLRINARGFYGKVLSNMGATVLSMPPTEIYMAMQKGILDGFLAAPTTALGYRVYEVGKGYLRVPFGGMGCNGLITLDAWKKLGSENQRILLEVRDKMLPKFTAEINGASETKALEVMKKAGVEIVNISPKILLSLTEKYGKPIWEECVKEEMTKSKLPFKEVFDAVLKAKEKYGAP